MNAIPDEQLRRMVDAEIREINTATHEAMGGDYQAVRERICAWAESAISETWGPFATEFDQFRAGALVDRCLSGATQVMAGMEGGATAVRNEAVRTAVAEYRKVLGEEAARLRAVVDCAHDLMLALAESGDALEDLRTRDVQRAAADLLTHFPDVAAMFEER